MYDESGRSISLVHDGVDSMSRKTSRKEQMVKDAADLQSIKSQDRDNQLIGNAREEGFREGFSDFERRMANSNQWAPVVEGSPQDMQMQENIDRGLNYQEPQGPSLLDSISGLFGSRHEEPVDMQPQQSAFLQEQEFDYEQNKSEQAGLSELEQLLRNQQR